MDFKDAGFKTWTVFKWFRMSPVAGFCEHSHELSGVIKGREFLNQLSDSQLINKDSVHVSGMRLCL
jgi:hypothetical protein